MIILHHIIIIAIIISKSIANFYFYKLFPKYMGWFIYLFLLRGSFI